MYSLGLSFKCTCGSSLSSAALLMNLLCWFWNYSKKLSFQMTDLIDWSLRINLLIHPMCWIFCSTGGELVGMSEIMQNFWTPALKFSSCSVWLLSSTCMLVWSGFFMVCLWITCFHDPLWTGMLYFECDPVKNKQTNNKQGKKTVSPAPFSVEYSRVLNI